MLTAAVLMITKNGKQPTCPGRQAWIKKRRNTYRMEYYSAIKKEQNNATCSNMNGPRACDTE